MLEYGLRQGEIVQLEWSDIDFSEGTISIKNSENRRTKNRMNRTLLLNDSIRAILLDWKSRQVTEARKLIDDRVKRTGVTEPYPALPVYLFPKQDGTRRKPNDAPYRRAWVNIKKKAGLAKDVVPYSMRHTFAVRMVESGQSEKTITETMGHRSSETQKHYTKFAKPTYTLPSIEDIAGEGSDNGV